MPSDEGCATCQGFVFVLPRGEFVAYRETVGMVCPTCGHDYGVPEPTDPDEA